jgi:hypothetical protein
MLHDLDAVQRRHDEGRQRMLEWCGDPVDDLTAWTYELAGLALDGRKLDG